MLAAILLLGGLGAVIGFGLSWAAKKFAVHEDPRLEKVFEIMPMANCGACGAAGCLGFAENVVKDSDKWLGKCPVGGSKLTQKTAEILGLKIEDLAVKKVAQVICRGSKDKIVEKFEYEGIPDCKAASILGGGDKACPFGCLMLGTCQKVCPFGAVTMKANGLPFFDSQKCTGCGICIKNCPRHILRLVPAEAKQNIYCNSTDRGPVVRKCCQVGCIGCGLCVKKCAVTAIKMENNLAVIDYAKCTNCKECVAVCPNHCIADLLTRKEKVSAAA
jgi:Na+-translocating ferredoxin:NAD+ oxidoreductase subunit B